MIPPIRQETASSIRAAWRIALRDPDAMAGFNLSADGFWRSFYAAILLLPPYAVLFGLSYMELPPAERPAVGAYAGAKALLYLAGWISFPLVMIPITRLLRIGDAYVPMIIACNWASVVRMAVWLPLAALFTAGIVDGDLASATALAAYATLQFYMYLVIRTSARCDVMTAAGIVALDAVLSLLLEQGVGQLV